MDKLPPKSAEALHKEATQARPGRSKPANLRDQVSNSYMWPTPKAHEPGMTAKTTGRGVEKSTHLTTQVALAEGMIDRKTGRLWPTPQAHKITRSGEIVNADGTPWDGIRKPHSKTTGRQITTALADAVAHGGNQTQQSGQLNPEWVEWLMGWPLGWTDSAQSGTDKFRQWCRSHGISYDQPPMKFNKSNA
jgi:hypothetical protein